MNRALPLPRKPFSGPRSVPKALRSCRARLSPGPDRFSPSERRRPLAPHPPGSNRRAIVVGRRRDLRAAGRRWAAASALHRSDRSRYERELTGGRAPRVPVRSCAQWFLPPREHSVRRHVYPVWPRLRADRVAGNGALLIWRRSYLRTCYGSQVAPYAPSNTDRLRDSPAILAWSYCRSGRQHSDPSLPQVLSGARFQKAQRGPRRNRSRKGTSRFRLGRNGATAESSIPRPRARR